MSKIKESDMQPEYDFSKGVRGKHYRAYQEGTNIVGSSGKFVGKNIA